MCIGCGLISFVRGVMGRFPGRFYIHASEDQLARFRLAAGPMPLAEWGRRVLDAVTVEVYGLESPSLGRDFARWVVEHPLWDEPPVPEGLGARSAAELRDEVVRLRFERLRALRDVSPPRRVELCNFSRLPRFMCSCNGCRMVS